MYAAGGRWAGGPWATPVPARFTVEGPSGRRRRTPRHCVAFRHLYPTVAPAADPLAAPAEGASTAIRLPGSRNLCAPGARRSPVPCRAAGPSRPPSTFPQPCAERRCTAVPGPGEPRGGGGLTRKRPIPYIHHPSIETDALRLGLSGASRERPERRSRGCGPMSDEPGGCPPAPDGSPVRTDPNAVVHVDRERYVIESVARSRRPRGMRMRTLHFETSSRIA